jgi:hypothetical protein
VAQLAGQNQKYGIDDQRDTDDGSGCGNKGRTVRLKSHHLYFQWFYEQSHMIAPRTKKTYSSILTRHRSIFSVQR